MDQIEFQIPEGYVLDEKASTDSKLVYKNNMMCRIIGKNFVKPIKGTYVII